MAMAIATVTTMRLGGDEEGKGKGCKGDGNSNEGGGQQRGQRRQGNGYATRIAGEWTATATKRAMVTATRVAGE
jgi:hypothetical protein